MLVVIRKKGQSIMIGADITVTVLSVKGKQVRIGVAAPHSVSVHREEVYEQFKNGTFGRERVRAT